MTEAEKQQDLPASTALPDEPVATATPRRWPPPEPPPRKRDFWLIIVNVLCYVALLVGLLLAVAIMTAE
jgi:hypothetical protein